MTILYLAPELKFSSNQVYNKNNVQCAHCFKFFLGGSQEKIELFLGGSQEVGSQTHPLMLLPQHFGNVKIKISSLKIFYVYIICNTIITHNHAIQCNEYVTVKNILIHKRGV